MGSQVRSHTFVDFDREIISAIILLLMPIQEMVFVSCNVFKKTDSFQQDKSLLAPDLLQTVHYSVTD